MNDTLSLTGKYKDGKYKHTRSVSTQLLCSTVKQERAHITCEMLEVWNNKKKRENKKKNTSFPRTKI